MTNVPGIVPQPYPIVNYPGTFAIILRKVATPPPFFFIFLEGVLIANPPIFRGTFFGEKIFGGIFSADLFFRRKFLGGRRSDGGPMAVGRPSDGRPDGRPT